MFPVGSVLEQKRLPRVTLTLVVVNFAVFMLEPALLQLLGPKWIEYLFYGAKNPSIIGLFTSLFLHQNVGHVFFNNFYLWIFGPAVEERVGGRQFLLYYLAAGVAGNFLDAFTNILFDPSRLHTGLGASGAISGVMALYAYRCWHAKLKMLLPISFLPIRIKIPAVPILIFWFLQDVFFGIISFKHPTGIGHWAHVGGFICGLAIARVKRYGHEAAKEYYGDRVMEEARSGRGWKGMKDEAALLKLAELSPDDPDVRLQLAQYLASKGEIRKAGLAYAEAVQKFFVRNPVYAAFALRERLEAGCGTMSLQYHLRAAEALATAGFAQDAYTVLKPAITHAIEAPFGEKAQLLFIRLCREVWKPEEAEEAFKRFEALFPKSRLLDPARKALKQKPGEIFPKPKIDLPESATQVVYKEDDKPMGDAKLAHELNACVGIMSDPLFFVMWLLFLPVLTVVRDPYVYALFIMVPAYLVTASIRACRERRARREEKESKKAAAEADASTLLNRALLADRGENYLEASVLYEKSLRLDPLHIQARFNLARIYHRKLDDRNNALKHYRKLLEVLPQDHPYRNDAETAISTGCK